MNDIAWNLVNKENEVNYIVFGNVRIQADHKFTQIVFKQSDHLNHKSDFNYSDIDNLIDTLKFVKSLTEGK